MEGLRHQGRPRRQWIHDIEEWTGCEYIQLKEMSQDRAQWRRKTSEWSSTVANPHRARSTSERVSVNRKADDRGRLAAAAWGEWARPKIEARKARSVGCWNGGLIRLSQRATSDGGGGLGEKLNHLDLGRSPGCPTFYCASAYWRAILI